MHCGLHSGRPRYVIYIYDSGAEESEMIDPIVPISTSFGMVSKRAAAARPDQFLKNSNITLMQLSRSGSSSVYLLISSRNPMKSKHKAYIHYNL